MFQSLAQVRKWLVVGVCVLVAAVSISYWIARSRVQSRPAQRSQQLGIDIQQTSDGFSLSKSEGGRTIYTIKASKAVQFKQGGHAELKNVHIVVYGKNHDRYDQIYGDQFTYDPDDRRHQGGRRSAHRPAGQCRGTERSPTRRLPPN